MEYYFFAGVAGAAPVPNNLLQKPGPVKVINTVRTSSPLASSSIYEIEIEPFVLPTSSAQPFHSSTPYPAVRKSPKKQLRFPRNEGMRIDFVMGSPAFADAVVGAEIVREERRGDAPSDHVPVLVEIDADSPLDDDRPMIF